ncbi:hypothetical protein D3C81_1018040 [compost metagenome]
MLLQHRLDDLTTQAMRNDRFDADLLHPFELTLVPDIGISAFPGLKRAIALQVEAAMAVVADMACARVQHSLQYLLMVVLRHKDDKLIKVVRMHIFERTGAFDSQDIRHPIVHPAVCDVEVRMGDINGDIVFDQFFVHLPHRGIALQMRQRTINDRMMGNNQICFQGDRLIYDFFINVKRYQDVPNLLLQAAQLESDFVSLHRYMLGSQ